MGLLEGELLPVKNNAGTWMDADDPWVIGIYCAVLNVIEAGKPAMGFSGFFRSPSSTIQCPFQQMN